MRALLDIILLVLQIYIWLLIAAAVLSWLIAFNVVNTRNQVVATGRRIPLPADRACCCDRSAICCQILAASTSRR